MASKGIGTTTPAVFWQHGRPRETLRPNYIANRAFKAELLNNPLELERDVVFLREVSKIQKSPRVIHGRGGCVARLPQLNRGCQNGTLSFRREMFVKILKRYQLDVRLA